MSARAFVGLGLISLLALGAGLGYQWRERDAARARAGREASSATAAKLAQLENKIDRLELSLRLARADLLAACNAPPEGAALRPEAPRAVEMAPETEVDDSAAISRLDAASREVDDAVRRGRWSTEDGARFEATIAPLAADMRQQALGRLSQAINTGRLDPESGAFPF